MKKHVSLFLALLMVFSVLFATSVEAAHIEPMVEQSQDSASAVTVCEEIEAPRVSDPVVGTNALVGPGTGGGHTHSYKYVQRYNGSYHKKACKCGAYFLVAHTFDFSMSATTHSKYCSVCGYYTTASHTFSYSHDDSSHWKYCSCGYKTTSEAHSLSCTDYYYDGRHHKLSCKCGFSCPELHEYVFDCFKPNENGGYDYYYICRICGVSLCSNIKLNVNQEMVL